MPPTHRWLGIDCRQAVAGGQPASLWVVDSQAVGGGQPATLWLVDSLWLLAMWLVDSQPGCGRRIARL